MGLLAEEGGSKGGYLGSGLLAGPVRETVVAINGKRKPVAGKEAIVFSRAVRRTFEAAANVRTARGTWEGRGMAQASSCAVHGACLVCCAQAVRIGSGGRFGPGSPRVRAPTRPPSLHPPCRKATPPPPRPPARDAIVTQECKRAGTSFITPEHILVALLNANSMPDAAAKNILIRCGQDWQYTHTQTHTCSNACMHAFMHLCMLA
eukprot:352861-Chlamydomonas_euryale.AAC.18